MEKLKLQLCFKNRTTGVFFERGNHVTITIDGEILSGVISGVIVGIYDAGLTLSMWGNITSPPKEYDIPYGHILSINKN